MLLKKIAITICILCALSPLGTSYACGNLVKEVQLYWEPQMNKERFFESLYKYDCNKSAYDVNLDKSLLSIIYDAVTNQNVDKELLRKVFIKFNCLYNARNTDKYSTVSETLLGKNNDKLCSSKEFDSLWFVAAKSGGIIRAGKSINSNRIGVIRSGMIVTVIEHDGEWFAIESIWGNGYMHKSVLKRY